MIEKELLRRAIREEIQKLNEKQKGKKKPKWVVSPSKPHELEGKDIGGGLTAVRITDLGGYGSVTVKNKAGRSTRFMWRKGKKIGSVEDAIQSAKSDKQLKEGRILTEARLPKDINDVTIMMLHTGMNKAVIKLLDGVGARTGSNANPISIQILDGWSKVKKEMMSKGNLKGQEAVDWFLHVALTEFNTDAPFISGLFRKYKLNKWKY